MFHIAGWAAPSPVTKMSNPPGLSTRLLLPWPPRSYHGDVPSDERSKSLVAFREGRCQLLVATDIAARGYVSSPSPMQFIIILHFKGVLKLYMCAVRLTYVSPSLNEWNIFRIYLLFACLLACMYEDDIYEKYSIYS